jgi:hypothetical protein
MRHPLLTLSGFDFEPVNRLNLITIMDFTLSDLDRAIALIGFGITIWQLYKTKSAAEAAMLSADQAVTAIKNLEAITKMHDISSRTRELLRLLRDGSFALAAAAAFELRDTVARYRDPNHLVVVQYHEWAKAVDDVRALHDKLEGLATLQRTRAKDRELLLLEVARLHTFFTKLAAKV